jgi:AAA15 family ATPase/GTPase
MIKDLKIKNFKCFKEFEIDNFKQVNLITGKNNSGKTSLLEAIAFLLEPFFIFLFIKTETFDYDSLISMFNKGDTGQKIEIKNISDNLKLYITSQMEKVSEEDIKKDDFPLTEERKFKFEHYSKDKTPLAYKIRPFSTKPSYINVTGLLPNFRFVNYGGDKLLADFWDEVQIEKKEDEIINILQEIEPKLTRIIVGKNNLLRCDVGYDTLLPFNTIGDGMYKLLSIVSALYQSKGGAVLIDEIENGFHYSMHRNLWKVIFKSALAFNVQVFATTHLRETIRAFYEECAEINDEKLINYYRLEKRSDDKIKYVEYTPEELYIALKNNLETR